MKSLIFLITGTVDNVIKAHQLDKSNCEVIKIDDKTLRDYKFILGKISEKKCDAVYFSSKELEFARFQIFMKVYMLLSFSFKGGVIDELGNKNSFNVFKLFFVELPFFAFEILMSLFAVIYYHVEYPVVKWWYKKK